MSRRTAHILAWLLAFATCAVMLTILEVADYALWSAIPVAVAGTPILAFEIWRSRRFPSSDVSSQAYRVKARASRASSK